MSNAGSSISVLCVDDEPGMADLIGTYLERFDEELSVTTATTAHEALERLENSEFDCIVSDYDMPKMDGLVFLEAIRADHPGLPFVLFTGRGSEGIASEAISAGVTDYMRKESGTDQYRVLAQRIHNAVVRHRLSRNAATVREHAETILQASPNGILVGIDGRCAYANPAAVELLSPMSESEVLGESISSLLRHRNGTEDIFREVKRGEELIEQRRLSLITQTGEIPLEGTARQITWNDSPAVVYIFQDVSERIEYEQKIEYRQSLLDSIFETSDGIIVSDDELEILAYNDKFADLWGISEDVLESGDGSLVLESVIDTVESPETFVRTIENRRDHPEETHRDRVRLTGGRVFDQYSAPVRLQDGTHRGHVWFYRDITELTQLQRAQQEAFDRMTDAVFAVDEEWTFTYLNDRVEQLLHRDTDELLGKNLWSEFPDVVDTEIYERYHEAMNTGEPVSFEYYYEPLEIDLEIRAFPSDTGLTVYFQDITEKRRTESELNETVTALNELYRIASDLELSLDAKQNELLEIGCEFLDLPYGFVTDITDTTQTIVASTGTHELLQPGESCPLEESYCRKTISTERGLLAVQNASVEGWTDDPAYETFELGAYIGGKVLVNGELSGTICFAGNEPRKREFSEIESTFVELLSRWLSYELEHREHRAQLEAKNAQLEEFASIVSHDLRNPLSVASGYLKLAMEESDSEHLPRVEKAHTRMLDLIEEILLLAREGDMIGEKTHVDLAAVSESCWRTVETEDATLSVDADGSIVADKSRLTQLLENLIRNAVEHGGSDVTVTIGDLPDGFYVEDTGVGIVDEKRRRLFEAGYSTKESGTGIGLRIAKQIVTAHGWNIEAVADSEGGARFEITGVERL